MNSVEELCCYYVAFLRAVALIHQNHHWTTKGREFYGNHLLFERIYNGTLEDIDLMAERFIGVYGDATLDLALQSKIIQQTLDKYAGDEPIKGSLKVEEEFLKLSEHIYEVLKNEDVLSLGTDDAIMSVASNHENHTYLLKQASLEIDTSVSSVVARTNLLKRLQKIG